MHGQRVLPAHLGQQPFLLFGSLLKGVLQTARGPFRSADHRRISGQSQKALSHTCRPSSTTSVRTTLDGRFHRRLCAALPAATQQTHMKPQTPRRCKTTYFIEAASEILLLNVNIEDIEDRPQWSPPSMLRVLCLRCVRLSCWATVWDRCWGVCSSKHSPTAIWGSCCRATRRCVESLPCQACIVAPDASRPHAGLPKACQQWFQTLRICTFWHQLALECQHRLYFPSCLQSKSFNGNYQDPNTYVQVPLQVAIPALPASQFYHCHSVLSNLHCCRSSNAALPGSLLTSKKRQLPAVSSVFSPQKRQVAAEREISRLYFQRQGRTLAAADWDIALSGFAHPPVCDPAPSLPLFSFCSALPPLVPSASCSAPVSSFFMWLFSPLHRFVMAATPLHLPSVPVHLTQDVLQKSTKLYFYCPAWPPLPRRVVGAITHGHLSHGPATVQELSLRRVESVDWASTKANQQRL